VPDLPGATARRSTRDRRHETITTPRRCAVGRRDYGSAARRPRETQKREEGGLRRKFVLHGYCLTRTDWATQRSVPCGGTGASIFEQNKLLITTANTNTPLPWPSEGRAGPRPCALTNRLPNRFGLQTIVVYYVLPRPENHTGGPLTPGGCRSMGAWMNRGWHTIWFNTLGTLGNDRLSVQVTESSSLSQANRAGRSPNGVPLAVSERSFSSNSLSETLRPP